MCAKKWLISCVILTLGCHSDDEYKDYNLHGGSKHIEKPKSEYPKTTLIYEGLVKIEKRYYRSGSIDGFMIGGLGAVDGELGEKGHTILLLEGNKEMYIDDIWIHGRKPIESNVIYRIYTVERWENDEPWYIFKVIR